MDRVVSQLLAEVDGVQAGASGGDLFVIGATNRFAHLPTALVIAWRRSLQVLPASKFHSTCRLLLSSCNTNSCCHRHLYIHYVIL